MTYTAEKFSRAAPAMWSVALRRNPDNKLFWVDVWLEWYQDYTSSVHAEWNQFIFNLNNEDDCYRRQIQETPGEFDEAMSEAIYYLEQQGEIKQDDKANWFSTYKVEEKSYV